jgi:putative ABC transport system permease protein
MSELLQDLRYALRTLRKAPGFAAIAMLTLALGIGSSTAIFSLVNATLLRELPYPDADRIVRVYETTPMGRSTVSPPDFTDWRAEADAFAGMAAYHPSTYTLTGTGDARQVQGAQVTGDFFSVMAARPVAGRFLSGADAEPGAEDVVVLGEATWRTDFGGERSIVGRRITLDGEPYTVAGIAPAGFAYPRGTEIWTPRAFDADDLATQRGAHYLAVIGRLASSTTLERADAQVSSIADRLADAYPNTNRETSAEVVSLRDALVGDARETLFLLLGAVSLVLLIACANVANLLVARALRRRRDLALRQAVGASRARLTRLVLVESMVLSLGGGALGVFLAAWGTPLLARLRPDDAFLQSATIDLRVLVVTVLVSLATGVLFGIFPALRLVPSRGLSQQLVGGGRGSSATAEAHRARRILVTAEMTLAFVLLVGSGLLLRSFVALHGTDLGFATASRLTFSLATPDARYASPDQVAVYYDQVIERVAALPGVEELGATQALPLSGTSYGMSMHSIDGRVLESEEQDRLTSQLRVVRPGFFSALQIPVLRGRAIEATDRPGASDAVVLNETAARRIFGDADPLGRELRVGTSFGLGRGRAGGIVVGIVSDTKDRGADAEATPVIYLSHAQFPISNLQIVARTSRSPASLARSVRAAVASVDPNVPLFGLQSMEERFAESLAQPRFLLTLIGLFAGVALLLATIGLYGVIAYGVTERTREIGIRLALGARERDVMRMIVRGGGALAAVGIALGLAAAFAGGRLLSAQLHGVQPIDPLTMAGAVLVLLPVALLASWIPARRATRVDPAITLRAE